MLMIDALNQIIDDGIEAARLSYSKPRDKQKLEGSIRGFEDCRDKAPDEIATLLLEANATAQGLRAGMGVPDDYWYWRCRALEIEWTANVLSAILDANGLDPIVPFTGQGVMKAAEIIGVADT